MLADSTHQEAQQIVRVHACEHSLDRLLGEALSKLELLDSHGTRPGDVPMDDGRAHIAGAIGLHPAILCEDKALHPLAEVFNPGPQSAG